MNPALASALFGAGLLAGCQAVWPVPDPAATVPSVDITEIAPGVWTHTSYHVAPDGTRIPSNGLVVRVDDHLLLVDTAWGAAQTTALLQGIAALIRLPVHRAIVTHAHGDRVAGADVLAQAGVEVLATPLTRSFAARAGLPVPEHSLDSLMAPASEVTVDGVQVYFPGPGHTPDNLVVWVPSQRVLFGGCAVRALDWSLGPLGDADLESWRQGTELLRRRFATAAIVVPGHGDAADASLLAHTAALLERALAADADKPAMSR